MANLTAHLSASGIAQITSSGRSLQEKNCEFTLESLAAGSVIAGGAPDLAPHAAAALESAAVRGAYLHIPFCFHKCHYCDFYSIVDSQDRQEAFINRMIAELRTVSPRLVEPLETIFIGGGTPTLLRVELWQQLLAAMHEYMPLKEGGEFSVEANPETVTAELADTLVRGGVDRISIGAQSFDERHLKMLERWHDPANVSRSIDLLRAAGIDNISLDLIFAVPGQSVEDWQNDLNAALALKPRHISCYGLMYEHNTPLTKRMESGAVTPVDQDIEAAMYEATIARLGSMGFEHYEISNWAQSATSRCRHNLLYWRNANWWAYGPSASGHINGLRWKNAPRLSDYLDSTGLPPIVDVEFVDKSTRAGEQFMLGLRLNEGLALADVKRLMSNSGERADARRDAIERHSAAGLLEFVEDRLRLTPRGLLLANDVLVDLI